MIIPIVAIAISAFASVFGFFSLTHRKEKDDKKQAAESLLQKRQENLRNAGRIGAAAGGALGAAAGGYYLYRQNHDKGRQNPYSRLQKKVGDFDLKKIRKKKKKWYWPF